MPHPPSAKPTSIAPGLGDDPTPSVIPGSAASACASHRPAASALPPRPARRHARVARLRGCRHRPVGRRPRAGVSLLAANATTTGIVAAVRNGRRRGVCRLRAPLEAAHAERQPGLLPEPDPALVPRSTRRCHHRTGRAGLVRVTPRDARRRRPLRPDTLREPPRGHDPRLPTRGPQSLPGHPALPRRGRERVLAPMNSAARRRARPSCRGPATRRRRNSTHPPHRVPQERDPEPRVAVLPGRQALPARQQDGPRTVWLSAPARAILAALPRTARRVIPGRRGQGFNLQPDWASVRTAAGLDDVRLHDCRHTYASIAMLQGESLRIIGNLLGHRQPATTLKYVHLGEHHAKTAVESIADVLGGGD